ncbi:MAG: DNA-directed RNA polymerase subunit omega [Defluviitaleaceae bacterium]|nr:DNA-directed RNA polymerase subunit omega [Defluviitaleaceae bacterium]
MLTPSYSELMDVMKQGEKLDSRVTSRYTVVLAAAKRARQLTDGTSPLTYAPTDRAVSIAVKEMQEGKLRIKVQSDLIDGSHERLLSDRMKYRGVTALSKDDLREDLKQDYAPTPYDIDDETYRNDHFAAEETAVAAVAEKEDDFGLYEDDTDEPLMESEESE